MERKRWHGNLIPVKHSLSETFLRVHHTFSRQENFVMFIQTFGTLDSMDMLKITCKSWRLSQR
jgi:hypothetical protein